MLQANIVIQIYKHEQLKTNTKHLSGYCWGEIIIDITSHLPFCILLEILDNMSENKAFQFSQNITKYGLCM